MWLGGFEWVVVRDGDGDRATGGLMRNDLVTGSSQRFRSLSQGARSAGSGPCGKARSAWRAPTSMLWQAAPDRVELNRQADCGSISSEDETLDIGIGSAVAQGKRAQAGAVDAGLPGLEALRRIHAGRSPQPPIHYWSGRRLVALQHGGASISMPASGWFCGPKGRLHPGIFAFLLDMTHLYAVMSTLPAGAGCTTAELSVTVLGEPPASGAEIIGRSRVIYSDERNALAEGLVVDQGGHPVAHSTSRYFLFAPGAVVPPRSSEVFPQARSPGTGAMLREPVPQIAPVGPELLQRLSGLEILAAQIKGEIPAAPIGRYAGIRPVEAGDGRVVFSLPVHPDLVQELGTVFGGVIALLAKSASGAAVQTIAPAGTGFTALDLKVNFLRPARAEGDELIATGLVSHRGRRLSIANAVVTYRGRRIAVATGTTALTPPK
jgi:uncharacterized protein (TIGR00369 family)